MDIEIEKPKAPVKKVEKKAEPKKSETPHVL